MADMRPTLGRYPSRLPRRREDQPRHPRRQEPEMGVTTPPRKGTRRRAGLSCLRQHDGRRGDDTSQDADQRGRRCEDGWLRAWREHDARVLAVTCAASEPQRTRRNAPHSCREAPRLNAPAKERVACHALSPSALIMCRLHRLRTATHPLSTQMRGQTTAQHRGRLSIHERGPLGRDDDLDECAACTIWACRSRTRRRAPKRADRKTKQIPGPG